MKIYQSIGNESSAIQAGAIYTNAVCYIKKQAVIGDQTFYLISKKLSTTNGVVGWVKSSDLTSYAHTTVDKDSKIFYSNFVNDSKQIYQVLDPSKPSEVSASALNSYLKGKGIFEGMGQAFIDASAANGIKDIFSVTCSSRNRKRQFNISQRC